MSAVVPCIQPNQVHVWRLPMVVAEPVHASLWSTLSKDEQARTQRLIRPQDQRGFVVVRGMLRRLLGEYLEIDAGHVQFSYGTEGKPQLWSSNYPVDLRFNLSHSQGMALVAITSDQEVGVDLEQINTRVDYDGISQRFFTVNEQQALRCLVPEQRCATFFQIWTRKEACIKAMGGSIATGLTSMDVASDLDQPMTTIATIAATAPPSKWVVYDLQPSAGYAGALALASPPQAIHTFEVQVER